jgi:hypothetical protein
MQIRYKSMILSMTLAAGLIGCGEEERVTFPEKLTSPPGTDAEKAAAAKNAQQPAANSGASAE